MIHSWHVNDNFVMTWIKDNGRVMTSNKPDNQDGGQVKLQPMHLPRRPYFLAQ